MERPELIERPIVEKVIRPLLPRPANKVLPFVNS
ncbi:MAG: hypothetical protein H7257_14130 [Taibaiella sp.]|nr:hypothetical protein [Taibaiella sp.]